MLKIAGFRRKMGFKGLCVVFHDQNKQEIKEILVER